MLGFLQLFLRFVFTHACGLETFLCRRQTALQFIHLGPPHFVRGHSSILVDRIIHVLRDLVLLI
jgi:hypothetical protein